MIHQGKWTSKEIFLFLCTLKKNITLFCLLPESKKQQQKLCTCQKRMMLQKCGEWKLHSWGVQNPPKIRIRSDDHNMIWQNQVDILKKSIGYFCLIFVHLVFLNGFIFKKSTIPHPHNSSLGLQTLTPLTDKTIYLGPKEDRSWRTYF